MSKITEKAARDLLLNIASKPSAIFNPPIEEGEIVSKGNRTSENAARDFLRNLADRPSSLFTQLIEDET